ncbi:MAG: hypothetical protein HFJ17_02790 [Clostridia bacterium]|nr:hypothetical protein [Clostridia bacterium]
MVISIIGLTGAGKTTRIKKAKKIISNMVSIPTESLMQAVGFANIDEAPDEEIISNVKSNIELITKNIVVIEGLPRTVRQAEMLEEMGVKIDRVIYLSIDEEEALKRLEDRLVCSNQSCKKLYTKSDFDPPKEEGICDICKSNLTKKEDDNLEKVKEKNRVFYKEVSSIIGWYNEKGVPVIKVGPKEHLCFFLNALTD